MKYVYFFDDNNFYTKKFDAISDNSPIPSNATTVKPTYRDANEHEQSFLKPIWDGSNWSETATADELAALHTQPVPTPTIEQQQIAQLLLITAQQAQQIAALQGASTNG